MRKNIIAFALCVFAGIFLCACVTNYDAEDAVTPDTSLSKEKEEKETKKLLWNQTEAEIVESMKKILSEQTSYNGDYSIAEHDTGKGRVYALTYNGVKTQNIISITENTKTKTNQIVLVSANQDNQVFDIGISAIIMVSDWRGRYHSLEEANGKARDIYVNVLIKDPDENGISSAAEVIDGVEYEACLCGEDIGNLWTFAARKPDV